MSVHGECDARFSKLRELLEHTIAAEQEIGAAVCVNIDGKNVVDIWGGYKDPERTEPWAKDTIGVVWSISKTITNLAALMCIDRGLLDPYEKVATYWPEFAANGKADIEVRHFLSHTAGLPTWEGFDHPEDIYDIPRATAQLASQAPWWTPGTQSGYHLITQGHLVGELVRRVSGKPLNEFIRTEITEPLGADFRLGVPEKDYPRVYKVEGPPDVPSGLADDSIPVRARRGTHIQADYSETKAFRDTYIGAGNGFSNARAVNRILTAVSLGGEVDGVRLLSQKTLDLIWKEQSKGVDVVLCVPVTFGIGYGLPNPDGPKHWIPEGRVCYWGGWGGHIAIMDCDRKLTITYTMNKMAEGTMGSQRTEAYVRAIYEALGVKV